MSMTALLEIFILFRGEKKAECHAAVNTTAKKKQKKTIKLNHHQSAAQTAARAARDELTLTASQMVLQRVTSMK